MKISLMLLAVALLAACGAHALDVPSAADQIASAVLAAPEDRRARAGVQGYNAQGERVTLREGDNDLICRADNPKRERFSVRCRHRDVEAYFARNRELRAQGLRGKERQAALQKEIDEGKLSWGQPRIEYRLVGSGFDAASGEVTDSHRDYLIFVPYATPETIGLSTNFSWDAPWLMYSGKPLAHIMINQSQRKKKQ